MHIFICLFYLLYSLQFRYVEFELCFVSEVVPTFSPLSPCPYARLAFQPIQLNCSMKNFALFLDTFLEPVELQLEKAMAPHSSTLAWKIPWVEEPGRLQSMGSLRIGHD